MPRFTFKARNTQNELISGTRVGNSQQEVMGALAGEGLTVFEVSETGEKKAPIVRKRGAIRQQEIAIFCRQLATMINAGVSILDAIDDVAEMVTNRRFHTILKSIVNDIKAGSTLSEAMRKHQRVFGRIFVSMIAAGEKSGKLPKVLQDLALYLENAVKLKRKVRAASVYPMLIAGFFFVTIIVLVLFIIPRFKTMFASFGAELPLPTKIIMIISDAMVHNIHWLFLLITGIVLGFGMVYRTAPGHFYIDDLRLKLPIFGVLLKKIIFARFFQTLSTLLKSSVDIVASLEIASQVANNVPIEKLVIDVKNRVVEGSTLSGEMEKSPIFPRMVVRMTSVGEKSGKLDEMFNKLSDYYSDEVDAAVVMMSSIIEPILIILLGIVVAIVVIAMYLPIFKLAMAVMTQQ